MLHQDLECLQSSEVLLHLSIGIHLEVDFHELLYDLVGELSQILAWLMSRFLFAA